MMLSLSSFRIKENRLPHVYDVDIKETAIYEKNGNLSRNIKAKERQWRSGRDHH
ncbi:hypothetical protein [Proteiniphilum sp.]|uniref:hypothetical protein n=1 Tax=Proteiniphilum sp. TaxID=1926877 RepID=UPI002B1FCBDC|nr:hypothetical protein [Proteiniphilum sp.]